MFSFTKCQIVPSQTSWKQHRGRGQHCYIFLWSDHPRPLAGQFELFKKNTLNHPNLSPFWKKSTQVLVDLNDARPSVVASRNACSGKIKQHGVPRPKKKHGTFMVVTSCWSPWLIWLQDLTSTVYWLDFLPNEVSIRVRLEAQRKNS